MAHAMGSPQELVEIVSIAQVTADQIRSALPDPDTYERDVFEIKIYPPLIPSAMVPVIVPKISALVVLFEKASIRYVRPPKGRPDRGALWERNYWVYGKGGPDEKNFKPGPWKFKQWV